MKVHYSSEDIGDYLDYEDPEAVMLAARKAAGLPAPIPLAEPWEPAPPILMNSHGKVAAWQPPASAAWLAAHAYPESTADWLAARRYPPPAGDAVDGNGPNSSPASAPAPPARGQSPRR